MTRAGSGEIDAEVISTARRGTRWSYYGRSYGRTIGDVAGDTSRLEAERGDVGRSPGELVHVPPRLVALMAAVIVGATLTALLRPTAAPAADPDRIAPEGASNVGIITGELPQPGAAGRIGAPAPDFGWTTPEGDTRRLSDLRGHPVVMNFWATWCVPCREEMPALDRVAAAHPEATFLELDLQEDGPTVRGFFDQFGLRRLVPLLDRDGALARRYAVAALPTTFFVDAGGTIRHLAIGGPMSVDQVEAGLTKASQP